MTAIERLRAMLVANPPAGLPLVTIGGGANRLAPFILKSSKVFVARRFGGQP
jgi:hypothetical protein